MSEDNFVFDHDKLNQRIKELAFDKWAKKVAEIIACETLKEFMPEQSNQQSVDNKDWEIQCIQRGYKNYWLQKDGLFKCELFEEHAPYPYLLNNSGIIYQVKRLSDNEVLTIGDEGSATWMVRKEKYKIKSFIIEDGEMKVKGDDFLIPINVFEKTKQPETEYGKSYTRNYCWVIDGKRIPEQTKSEPNLDEENKPIFSYNDLKKIAYIDDDINGLIHLSVSDLKKFIQEKLK